MQVSGIITTYRRDGSVVRKAIQSMLDQTYKLLEIIVVDDNPNDSPYCESIKKVCTELGAKYIKQDGNKGACVARNLGIENAKGEFVAFLDDDDLWRSQKIERQLSVFEREKSEETGLVFCNGTIRFLPSGAEKKYNESSRYLTPPTFEDMLVGDKVGSTSIPLIKKSVFEDVGGFWVEQPARQDYEMWLRIVKKYKIVGIDEDLFIHTMHDGEQISKSKKRSYIGYKNIYEKYKPEFKKNPVAYESIISRIWTNVYSFSFFNMYVFCAKVYFKLKSIFCRTCKKHSKT